MGAKKKHKTKTWSFCCLWCLQINIVHELW